MDANIFAVFFLKVIGDVSFRIAIFFAFLCTVNDGQFSTKIIVGYYYGVALIVMVFVFIPFSNREERMSFRHWIGKVIIIMYYVYCISLSILNEDNNIPCMQESFSTPFSVFYHLTTLTSL